MTSSALLTERILAALRAAACGSYAPRNPAERYDINVARNLSPEERLHRLDEILRFVESAKPVPVASMKPIRCSALRM